MPTNAKKNAYNEAQAKNVSYYLHISSAVVKNRKDLFKNKFFLGSHLFRTCYVNYYIYSDTFVPALTFLKNAK